MRFQNDQFGMYGIFILTDDKEKAFLGEEYLSVMGCSLFTFPFKAQPVAHMTLRTIKRGKVIDLLTSAEFPGLASDSYFKVLKAHKRSFEKESTTFDADGEDDDDEVRRCSEEDYIHAIVITSDSADQSKLFPITHEVSEEQMHEVSD